MDFIRMAIAKTQKQAYEAQRILGDLPERLSLIHEEMTRYEAEAKRAKMLEQGLREEVRS